MIRKFLIALVAVCVLLALAVATRPSSFHVERSGIVPTPPEMAFVHVNDFHAWAGWSPWEKLDPAVKKEYSGAPNGAGSIYSWNGNDKAGEGRMTIEKSEPSSSLAIKLEFTRPFPSSNQTTFSFTPVADGSTKVTWAMDGQKNFMAKAAFLFMDIDKQVGGDFERGLTQLAAVAKADFDARAQAEAAKASAEADAKAAGDAQVQAATEAAKAEAAAEKKGREQQP